MMEDKPQKQAKLEVSPMTYSPEEPQDPPKPIGNVNKEQQGEEEDKKRSAEEAELSASEESEEGEEEYVLDPNRFPDKVWFLLDNQIAPEAIWWLPEGDALAVNKDAFSMPLLIRHFRGNKFSSFTRNLNRWGFRRVSEERVPEGVLGYVHDMFQRSRPGLLKKMKKEVYTKKEKQEDKEGTPPKKKKKKTTRKPKLSKTTIANRSDEPGTVSAYLQAVTASISNPPPVIHKQGGLMAGTCTRGLSPENVFHSRLLAERSSSSALGGISSTMLSESLPRTHTTDASGSTMPASAASHALAIQMLALEQNQADNVASSLQQNEALAVAPSSSSYAPALPMATRAAAATTGLQYNQNGTDLAFLSSRLPSERLDSSTLGSLLRRTPAPISAGATLQNLLEASSNQDALQQLARQRQLEDALEVQSSSLRGIIASAAQVQQQLAPDTLAGTGCRSGAAGNSTQQLYDLLSASRNPSLSATGTVPTTCLQRPGTLLSSSTVAAIDQELLGRAADLGLLAPRRRATQSVLARETGPLEQNAALLRAVTGSAPPCGRRISGTTYDFRTPVAVFHGPWYGDSGQTRTTRVGRLAAAANAPAIAWDPRVWFCSSEQRRKCKAGE